MSVWLWVLFASAGFGSEVRLALERGWESNGIKVKELGFYKQWATDSFFRLRAVDRLLDEPLTTATFADSLAGFTQGCTSSPVRLLRQQCWHTDIRLEVKDSARLWREILAETAGIRATSEGRELIVLPSYIAEAVGLILAGYRVSERYLRRAVAGLTPKELDRLLGVVPSFWQEKDNANDVSWAGILHRELGRDYDTAEVRPESVLSYVRKLDRRSLALCGLSTVLAACEGYRLLRTAPVRVSDVLKSELIPGVQGEVYAAWETEFGWVVIGTEQDNLYRRDCCLVIELGGDDTYLCRAAGAVGFLHGPFGVVIDLAGNDRYECDRPFNQGAACLGVGVLIDASGNDTYRAGSYAQGTGIMGMGLLWDENGDDIYAAENCVQGAGHFGCGLLVERAGNDCYRSSVYCQGFGSTWGFGACVDYEGNDGYFAGGRYRHEPLLPQENRSFGQGFAMGWRPDAAGGIGFLYDRTGNDFYNAEVYAQGTAYWYSLGALWDGSGYDHYTAAQYAQGAGIHLAVGCLLDNEGNDSYYSRLGPSQGSGHDLSVGVLLDRRGNDVYHASGGMGMALSNAVGLFCDVTGNDVYSCSEAAALGGAVVARGFASVGSFLDLAGKDRYTAGSLGQDSSCWNSGSYGFGVDAGMDPVPGDEAAEGDSLIENGLLSLPLDSIFRIASTWEVGNARARVRQARRQLLAAGRRAIEYVFDNKLDTKDGLESRAIEELVKAWPDTARPFLLKALRDKRWQARNNAAYWLGKMGRESKLAVDSLLLALREKRISSRRAAGAFGDIGDSLVVPHILYLLKDKHEPTRIVTAEACGKLRNPAAIPQLLCALGDEFFTVRSAAEMALVSMGVSCLDSLLKAWDQLRPPALGHALRAGAEIAARLDSSQVGTRSVVWHRLVPYLKHSSVFVRLAAVQGLAKLQNEEVREILERASQQEQDTFVLAAYRQALNK